MCLYHVHDVRLLAAQKLKWSKGNQAIAQRSDERRDGSPDVVAVVASALGYLKAEQALPALKTVAAHDTRQTEDGAPVADTARRAIASVEGNPGF